MRKLNFKTLHRYIPNIILYISLILLGYWAGGNGIKDPWDKLMTRSKNLQD